MDNNHVENQIRPITIGNGHIIWLFAGSLQAGQRGTAMMSLSQSARLNGHDPYAYFEDVLARPPIQQASLNMNAAVSLAVADQVYDRNTSSKSVCRAYTVPLAH